MVTLREAGRVPGGQCCPCGGVQSHVNGSPGLGGTAHPGPVAWCGPGRMGSLLLAVLLALASVPRAQAVWLGRLDPKQLLGPWYVLAVASREKSFAVEKDMKNVAGVVVTLTPENNLRMLSSEQGLEGCSQSVTELLKRNSGWVFENPSVGVLEFRVLGTNFRDYAIVFTQLEFGDEPFNTVAFPCTALAPPGRTETASQEAMGLFTKWSRGLGFPSQQQAQLQKDLTCARRILP
ncbi:epididymal-specific lipocalin-6 [Cebus imitator]|uniref:epididymal-specific lipocalin-6 n=1 Tax=Cebus imitator TaxID=2715852 RepID=UPI0018984B53|nr:epididymal-specific lipocalin-6 [Cebus imitator]